jgi:regulator of protease activity HflC (stomatin/prohibitin superfamily)
MVSTADISADLPIQKVTDSLGNPVIVSGIVVYRFTNPYGPLLTVQNGQQFVVTQASAIMKQVVSKYSYEELKVQSTAVNKELVDHLQQAVMRAGAEILSMRLNELNYAPEIAQSSKSIDERPWTLPFD